MLLNKLEIWMLTLLCVCVVCVCARAMYATTRPQVSLGEVGQSEAVVIFAVLYTFSLMYPGYWLVWAGEIMGVPLR